MAWDSEEIKTMLLLLKPVEMVMDKSAKVERPEFTKMLRSLPLTPAMNCVEAWGESRVVNVSGLTLRSSTRTSERSGQGR